MKIFFALLVLVLCAGCFPIGTGTSADVKSRQVVTLGLAPRDQVKVTMEGDPVSYFVGSEAISCFPGGTFWIRLNGERIDLQTAVRGSAPIEIKGTWVIQEVRGKKALYVYADPSKVPPAE